VNSFREAADELLAITADLDDEAVVTAACELRDVCAEYDEISTRFDAAGAKLMAVLLERGL
jgi:hypothetical protein